MNFDRVTGRTVTRRSFCGGAAAICAAGLLSGERAPAAQPTPHPAAPPEDYRIRNGRIKQSVMTWIFKMQPEAMMQACQRMGMHGIEGIGNNKDLVEKARKLGMAVSNAGSAGFKNAPLNRDHHEGYFGDDVDLCADMIRAVGSSRLKLLFDIYHVQIMNGDLVRRIRQYRDIIGHVHTAGVPGRHELDESQEINYPAVMRALVEIGYQGYVAHEFVPTWPDKLAALRHAVRLCDV